MMTAPTVEQSASRAIEWSPNGITRAAADGRYVKRYVNNVLAADSQSRTFEGGGTEYTLESKAGPILANVPSDAAPSLLAAGVGGIFYVQHRVLRLLADAAFVGVRANGTPSAPTAVASGNTIVSFAANPYNGTTAPRTATVAAVATETHGLAAGGTEWAFLTTPTGTVTALDTLRIRSVSAAEMQLLGRMSTMKIRPLSSGQLRNPSDTATHIEWNTTGVGFYGTAPIAKPTVTGSKAGNAALASLCAQLAALGLITDSTT